MRYDEHSMLSNNILIMLIKIKKSHDEPTNKTANEITGLEEDTSMTTLIFWNISKALQRNPHLDLKLAFKNVHERLGNTRDVNKIMTHSPEERHIACALLAWQELGNTSAGSLYDFIEDQYGDQERDKGEQTDDTKTKPTSSSDIPKQIQTVKGSNLEEQHIRYFQRPICTNKTKARSLENAEITMSAQTDKITNMGRNSKNLQLNTKVKPVENEDRPNKYFSDSLHHSICHTDKKDCKSFAAKVHSNEIYQGRIGNFCCNVYREEVSLNRNIDNKPESKRLTDTNNKEDLKCPSVATPTNPAHVSNIACPIQRNSREDFDTCSLRGPVVTLPPETNVVLRCEHSQYTCARHQWKKPREQGKNVLSKIDAACCKDNACAEHLSQVDKTITELRNRAARLARREAERAELLERAEVAWRDLELGYQRRLRLAEEKEYDLVKQTKKLLEERNGYKMVCVDLAKLLKERGDLTEKSHQELIKVEKEICALACTRMRLSEETGRSEATLTEQLIKVSQLDRDLKFKEEEKRRKLSTIQNEMDSMRALAVEAERAVRAEICAVRQQVGNVSNQLLREADENNQVNAELDSLREEKDGLVEDLQGCQMTCDGSMQKKMDELKKARDDLKELKDRVIECQCKVPIDAAVEVKRTPSLVAVCTCYPEDRLLESCSCTSLRSQLMTNLLADLFGGLQAVLGDAGAQMPCQLLKCLEDNHNWDRGSVVKSNLRTFFSQLLLGELDIAIATSIEKYHARWVGATCADTLRMIPEPNQTIVDDWQQVQERDIERRAQKLASKLAEQLFQERADQLVQRAKDAIKADPPICECKETAVFPCLVKPPVVDSERFPDTKEVVPQYWRRTFKDVTQLRAQIEDLRKEALKKEDLKRMEDNFFKLVQRPSEPEPTIISKENQPKEPSAREGSRNRNIISQNRPVKIGDSSKFPLPHSRSIRKKHVDINNSSTKNTKKILNERLNNNIKKVGLVQEFAINTCFCENQNVIHELKSVDLTHKMNSENKGIRKQSIPNDVPDQIKHTKPISGQIGSTLSDIEKANTSTLSSCRADGVCFHKIPSNTSIDKLLAKLTIWKSDLMEKSQRPIKKNISTNVEVMKDEKQVDSKMLENNKQSNIPYQASVLEIINNKKKSYKSTGMDKSSNMLINTTDSEYMGAVNLDKSDNECNCIVKTQKLKKGNKYLKLRYSPLKCINSELCECKKSLERKEDPSNMYNKSTRQESLQENSLENDLLLDSQSKKRIKRLTSDINKANKKVEGDKNIENENEVVFNNVVKTSDLSCNCDYYVKLLGVTLADISSHKVIDDLSNRKQKTESVVDSQDQEIIKQSNQSIKVKCDENALNVQCQCHVKLEEFKSFIENNFKKQWKPQNDKELDAQSFNENILNDEEGCVCCPMNESRELEVNTFYLLEEHLKGKLEELKKSCSQFSCLPAEEEEKLFSAILERVRQIISSSTNELTCYCLSKDESGSDGSWNRANTLLQEYLKTKIKKVQCFCGNDNRRQECVLPKVLDEIYSLIEKDFQRLKSVYDYRNTNDINKQGKGELPEKDINEYTNNNSKGTKDIEKSSKSNSNKSMIKTQNLSAQVSNNIEMVTKSINVMEKGNKNLQTSESAKSIAEKCFNSVEKENCVCDSMINDSIFCSQAVIVNHHTTNINNDEISNYSKKVDFKDNSPIVAGQFNEHSSPYIGYTIDCACKYALGTCTCVKSNIILKKKEVNNIWNDLTKDNIQPQNISYIMDSVSEKHKLTDFTERTVKTTNSNQTSKKIGSDFSDDEIVLKDSKRSVVVSNNSANTVNRDKLADESAYDVKNKRYHACHNCHVSKPILKHSIRSESHLPNSKDLRKTQSLNCDCSMVPICHVKMLVENIESRLYHSKCTCDSFNPIVCPVHSKRFN